MEKMFLLLFLFSSLVVNIATGETAEEWRRRGDEALTFSKYSEAIKFFKSSIEADPSNYLSHYKLSLALSSVNRDEESLASISRAISLKTGFVNGYLHRHKLHLKRGDISSSRSDLEEVIKAKPGDTSLYAKFEELRQADEVMKALKDADASRRYQEVLDTSQRLQELGIRSTKEVLLMRLEAASSLNEWNVVIEDGRKIIKEEPSNARALVLRGRAFLAIGEADAALKHFQSCLRYDPDNSDCKDDFKRVKVFVRSSDAASTAFEANDLQAAFESAKAALEVFPMLGSASYKLSEIVCRSATGLGQWDLAIKECSDALVYRPDFVPMIIARARAYVAKEMLDEATRDLQKASQLQPQNGEVRQLLHEVTRKQKMAQRKDYYKILDLPKDATIKDIKRNYRQKAKLFHPDKAKNEEEKANFEKTFLDVNEAYEVLSDNEKRGRYDNGEDLDQPQQQGFHGFHGFQQQGFNFNGQTFSFKFN